MLVLLFQRCVQLYSWSVPDCQHSFSGASDCCQCCTHAHAQTECTQRFCVVKISFHTTNEEGTITWSRGWPVGVREGDESKLFCAVQDQVLGHLTGMGRTQRSPEQEFRWRNHARTKVLMPFLNALIVFACQDAPTKSLWPVASMLLMLISSKSSSVQKRRIV